MSIHTHTHTHTHPASSLSPFITLCTFLQPPSGWVSVLSWHVLTVHLFIACSAHVFFSFSFGFFGLTSFVRELKGLPRYVKGPINKSELWIEILSPRWGLLNYLSYGFFFLFHFPPVAVSNHQARAFTFIYLFIYLFTYFLESSIPLMNATDIFLEKNATCTQNLHSTRVLVLMIKNHFATYISLLFVIITK
jgi:hypothetical protein